MIDGMTSEAEAVSRACGVPIEIDVVRRHGFDGLDTVLTVISFVAGGIGGGIVSSIGEDVWTGVKKLVGRTRRETHSECRVVVVQRVDGRELRFRCRADGEADVDRLVAALDELAADPVPGEDAVSFELCPDGSWRRVG